MRRLSGTDNKWRARAWLRVAAVWKHTRLVDQGVILKRADEADVYVQISY